MNIDLTIRNPRPYFAELPYYLWGEVNYDSEGDCRRPTDRQWKWFELRNRTTHERVGISSHGDKFTIESESPELAARTALFLVERSAAKGNQSTASAGDWSHTGALARTLRIRAEFPRRELKPFDSHLFWGSWKWVGWYATDLTWVGRWIMNSMLTRDTRAVFLCVQWLRMGPAHKDQSAELRYALSSLTGLKFGADQQWIAWYDDKGGQKYPEPDIQAWKEDLKRATH